MKKALAVNSNGSNNTSEENNKNINISLIFVFIFGKFSFVHHIKLKSYFFSHNKIMYEYEEN